MMPNSDLIRDLINSFYENIENGQSAKEGQSEINLRLICLRVPLAFEDHAEDKSVNNQHHKRRYERPEHHEERTFVSADKITPCEWDSGMNRNYWFFPLRR